MGLHRVQQRLANPPLPGFVPQPADHAAPWLVEPGAAEGLPAAAGVGRVDAAVAEAEQPVAAVRHPDPPLLQRAHVAVGALLPLPVRIRQLQGHLMWGDGLGQRQLADLHVPQLHQARQVGLRLQRAHSRCHRAGWCACGAARGDVLDWIRPHLLQK